MTEQAHRKRIGIFGGSFNPIHNGHICLARQILTAVSLDEIWFVVSPLNPFKQEVTDLLPDDVKMSLFYWHLITNLVYLDLRICGIPLPI